MHSILMTFYCNITCDLIFSYWGCGKYVYQRCDENVWWVHVQSGANDVLSLDYKLLGMFLGAVIGERKDLVK